MRAEKRRAGRAIRKARREARQQAEQMIASGELGRALAELADAVAVALTAAFLPMVQGFAAFAELAGLEPRKQDYVLTPAPGSPASEPFALPTSRTEVNPDES
ncbi:hypothetical protein [Microbacterium sp. KNMS]